MQEIGTWPSAKNQDPRSKIQISTKNQESNKVKLLDTEVTQFVN